MIKIFSIFHTIVVFNTTKFLPLNKSSTVIDWKTEDARQSAQKNSVQNFLPKLYHTIHFQALEMQITLLNADQTIDSERWNTVIS